MRERGIVDWLAPALIAACITSASGCGPSADEPYAGLVTHQSPGNEYVIRYRDPPWRVASVAGTALRLLIDKEGTGPMDSSLIVIPKYVLDVTLSAGGARALADADAAAAPALGEIVRVMPRAITTDSGDMGFEVITLRPSPSSRYKRYVSFDSTRGGNVRLVFEANPDLDDPEVTHMIRQVDVAP